MRARQTIGWNIRKFRVEAGLTMEELGGKSDVDASYVARVERGTVNVSIDIVERIATALKRSLIELVQEVPAGSKAPAPLRAGRRSKI
jgi:transcriptional regulator with XRE-family HTH domain